MWFCRSLGVISGMTGSGGTVGAVVTQLLLFSGSKFSKQTSISLMGMMMIVCTLPITLIYFPQWVVCFVVRPLIPRKPLRIITCLNNVSVGEKNQYGFQLFKPVVRSLIIKLVKWHKIIHCFKPLTTLM